TTGARKRCLLAVVHALEEPGELQHVFRHALAPLAANARIGKRLSQLLCVLRKRVQSFVLPAELVRQLPEGALPVVLGRAAEVTAHRHELLIDQVLLAVELGRLKEAFLLEERAVGIEQSGDELARVGRLWRLDRDAVAFEVQGDRGGDRRADEQAEYANNGGN